MLYPSLTVATILLSFNVTIIMILTLNIFIWLRQEPILSFMLVALVFGFITIMFRLGSSVDYY